jgi:hypothetical protein
MLSPFYIRRDYGEGITAGDCPGEKEQEPANRHQASGIAHKKENQYHQGMSQYRYIGDRNTDPGLKGQQCSAIKRNGKCLRGKNGNMLVQFGDRKVVVMARLLRKLMPCILIIIVSCAPPRIVDPYNLVVTVVAVRPASGGTIVTVRHKYILYERLFMQLPDSIIPGKTIVLPIFKRIN